MKKKPTKKKNSSAVINFCGSTDKCCVSRKSRPTVMRLLVMVAIAGHQHRKSSAHQIAESCGVSHTYVNMVRAWLRLPPSIYPQGRELKPDSMGLRLLETCGGLQPAIKYLRKMNAEYMMSMRELHKQINLHAKELGATVSKDFRVTF